MASSASTTLEISAMTSRPAATCARQHGALECPFHHPRLHAGQHLRHVARLERPAGQELHARRYASARAGAHEDPVGRQEMPARVDLRRRVEALRDGQPAAFRALGEPVSSVRNLAERENERKARFIGRLPMEWTFHLPTGSSQRHGRAGRCQGVGAKALRAVARLAKEPTARLAYLSAAGLVVQVDHLDRAGH